MSGLTATIVAELIVAARTDGHHAEWETRHLDLIRGRQRRLGLSNAELSRRALIPANALGRILNGTKSPTLGQVGDLCRAVGIRLQPPVVAQPGP